MIGRAKHRGFTLFEVVLAVALTVGIVGAMFALYFQSMKTRRRASEKMDMLLANRLAMEHITRELRAGMQLRFLKMGMEGSSEKAMWVSSQVPSPLVWAKRSAFETPPAPETDIQIVGYRLRTAANAAGQSVIEGLERTCQKILVPIVAEEGEENDNTKAIQVAFITSHVKHLRFRYWDGNGWQSSWTGGDLPGAVEITLGPQPWPADIPAEDFAGESFRRVIYIPAGVKPRPESSVGGLGGRSGL